MKKKYKVGDKIVEIGQVFRIFKIKREKNGEGEYERVIYFKPYYNTKYATDLVCSIPEKNIDKTHIRKPISRGELKVLFQKLKKRKRIADFPSITKTKENLKSADLSDTINVLKILYREKKKKPESFTKSKKEVLNSALDKVVQEFALVSGASLEKARKKINLALQG